MLAGGNITINSGNFKNKDSIVSAGGAAVINAGTFENSVTLGNAVPLKNGEERIVVYLNKKTSKGKRHYYGNINYSRSLYDGGVGYESGQPSVIEGRQVIVNAPNIVVNPIEAGNGVRLENGGENGRKLLSSSTFGIERYRSFQWEYSGAGQSAYFGYVSNFWRESTVFRSWKYIQPSKYRI